jgi:hypothetical protein
MAQGTSGWDLFQRIINWVFIVLVLAIVAVSVIAYYAVRGALQRLDVLVTTVKTATNRTVDSLVATLKTTRGVLQSVQHQVGDFIAVLEKNGKQGIYKVEKEFDLVRQDVDKVQHFVTDGDWKNTHIYADFKKAIHQVTDTILHVPAKVKGVVDGVEHTFLFKLKELNEGVVSVLDDATTPAGDVVIQPFKLGHKTVDLVNNTVNFTDDVRRATITWKNIF